MIRQEDISKHLLWSFFLVGIDIVSRIHVISTFDFNQGFLIKMKPVENTQQGADLLENIIVDVFKENHQSQYVFVAMEPTGFYRVHLGNYPFASNLLSQSKRSKKLQKIFQRH